MKKIIWLPLLFLSIGLTAQKSPELIKKVDGFSHPESVVYDEDRDVLYVSNIGESDTEDGFISRVSFDGEILELKWIEGLKDPKGLLVDGNKLYVTAVDQFVEMDIEKGEITKRHKIKNAGGLNDITIDAADNIFISDSRKSSIYMKLANSDSVEKYMSGEELENPNGLLAVRDYLYVSAWGQEAGHFLKIDLDIKEIEKLSDKPIGNLDGIQLTNEDTFIISDWATGNIYEIDMKGNYKKILQTDKSAGDILFHQKTKKLIIPMNKQNSVWWYQL